MPVKKLKPNRVDIKVVHHLDNLIEHSAICSKQAISQPLTQEQKVLFLGLSVTSLREMGFSREDILALFPAPPVVREASPTTTFTHTAPTVTVPPPSDVAASATANKAGSLFSRK